MITIVYTGMDWKDKEVQVDRIIDISMPIKSCVRLGVIINDKVENIHARAGSVGMA